MHEAGPVVALEAAASGVPTVGTYVGHIADWAPNLAWSVPVGDSDALADATIEALQNGRYRSEVGLAAQEWARDHDADWTASRFETLYKTLVD